MKNRQIRTALAAFVFSMMLLSLGCGGPNSNQTQISNAGDSANVALLATPTPRPNPCAGTNIDAKKTAVETAIQDKIAADPVLSAQFVRNVFKYSVVKDSTNTSLYIYLAGGMGNVTNTNTNANAVPHPFHEIMSGLRPLHKKGCVSKVILLPLSALPLTTTVTPAGFDWFGCEEPTHPCPGGVCSEVCGNPVPVASATPKGNSNSNTASNANTNSNGANNTP